MATEPTLPPRPIALLVRRQGRWWYPHELPFLPAATADRPIAGTD